MRRAMVWLWVVVALGVGIAGYRYLASQLGDGIVDKPPAPPPAAKTADDQVRDDQMFILATNQFRVAGGGGLPRLSFDRTVLRSPVNQQDALIRALAAPDERIWEDEQPWRLARTVRQKAVVETSPEALCYLDEIHQFAPEVLEQTDAGFIRLALML